MKTKNKIFALCLGASLLFAGLTGACLTHKTTAKEVRADPEVNNNFDFIYSDAFNNVDNGSSRKLVLLCWSGTFHGLAASTKINSETIGNKILVNGVAFSEFGANAFVQTYDATNNWLYVMYPKTEVVSDGATLEIVAGLTVGDSVCGGVKFTLANGLWARTFTNEINATFSSVYANDAYNNGSAGTGYKQVLIQYTGAAAQSSTEVPAIKNVKRLRNYDNYLTIGGATLASLADGSNTGLESWHSAQQWILIKYPESAVAGGAGTLLVVNAGFTYGNVTLNKFALRLNSSDKWETAHLIEDDELVANGDYLLFTPSDFGLNLQNDSIPFYGDVGSIFENSFAFQLDITIPAANISTTGMRIRFGATNIYGSSPLFVLYLNDSTAKFMLGVGSESNTDWDWNTYLTSPAWWTGDVTHLIEFYAIKTDSTNMVFLLGVDGELIWKTSAHDISGLDYTGRTFFNLENKGSTKDKSYYASAPTAEKALTRFGERKLKTNDIPFANNNDTGACRGGEGYYAQAKAFYNTYLTGNQRKEFATSSSYANHRARFIAWGAANGETISFNTTTGDLVLNSNVINPIIIDSKNSYIVVIVSSLALLSLAAFIFFKKKQQQ